MRPYNVLFVDGNHERFTRWETRPFETWRGGLTQRLSEDSPICRLCRGELFELGGSRVFVLGGAACVDKDWRTPGIDWRPQDLPSEEELAHADGVLAGCGWRADYVITHTCSNRMLSYALYPDKTWQTPECNRFTGYLDTLEDRLAFRRWFSATSIETATWMMHILCSITRWCAWVTACSGRTPHIRVEGSFNVYER